MNPSRRAAALYAASLALAARPRAEPAADNPDRTDDPAALAAARRQGSVVVYSSTDLRIAAPLLRDFESSVPGVRVVYRDMPASELTSRVMAEKAAGQPGADVVWSSAMDQQVKLLNDGHALAYRSPEAASLPPWAVWRDEGWGTTYEPAVFAYNTRLLAAGEVPPTHAALTRALRDRPARFEGRVVTYDVERSGVGFLLMTQDSRANSAFRELAAALGQARVRQVGDSEAMLDGIAAGQDLIGYNVLGSYARQRTRTDPRIGIVLPADYTLVLSRIAFISRDAPHPEAARLWLDHLLSRRGQQLLAQACGLGSVRTDAAGELSANGLRSVLGDALRPIALGPGLLTFLDQAKRRDVLRQWRQQVPAR